MIKTSGELQNRSSDEIRHEIARTRADLDETVDTLQQRLTPGQMVDELWHRFGPEGSGVVGGVGDVVREHPVPLALMGLGLGWLAVEQRSSSHRRVGPGTYGPAPGRRGPYGPEAVDRGGSDDSAGIADRAREMGEKARETLRQSGNRLDPRSSEEGDAEGGEAEADGESMTARVSESASEAVDRTRHRVQREGERAQRGFKQMLDENPLALGAIALGIGMVGAVSLPRTRTEDRVTGPASERVKQEAERAGSETAERAGRVAEEATSAAGEEVERQERERDARPLSETEAQRANPEGPAGGRM